MTTFEMKMEAGQKWELSEALEAIRTLDAAADEIATVDMRINPAWAVARLEAIDQRKRAIRQTVRSSM